MSNTQQRQFHDSMGLRLNDLLTSVRSYHPQADSDLIRRAFVYASKCHEGQMRKSGEPYFNHPMAVAHILAHMQLDEASICTGLLHDTVEDTSATLEEVEKLFGADVAQLVDGVTKLSKVKFHSSEEKQAENFRKMLVAMSRDIRVLLVKLVDRLHNMRTLQHHQDQNKQEFIARETLEIYAPLANRLGIGWLKIELEDLSFKYLQPSEYQRLKTLVGKTKAQRAQITSELIKHIGQALHKAGLQQAQVLGRSKHLWSIFHKMSHKQLSFEDVHDLIAFRVLVDTLEQCYSALGLVHTLCKPIPGRFKDYIAMPKPNGYQSLHTVVLGPHHERVEIQIRTRDMDKVAESGIAAHWQYKERSKAGKLSSQEQQHFGWLHQLMNWQKELADPSEFLDSVKLDLFSEEVYVFTPQAKVIALPRGATPVDFAFAIHSDVGLHCHSARVNDRIVPLRHQLHSGDTCHILTHPQQRPSRQWLEFVKTSRARTKIRAQLRQIQREHSKQIGTQMLDKQLQAHGMTLKKMAKSQAFAKLLAALPYQTLDDLVAAIGFGHIEPHNIVEQLLHPSTQKGSTATPGATSQHTSAAQNPAARTASAQQSTGKQQSGFFNQLLQRMQGRSSDICIGDVENLLVSYARCCCPVKGEDVVGFVTRSRGLVVHRRDCPRVLDLEPERRLNVSWSKQTRLVRRVGLQLLAEDRNGMLMELSGVFSQQGVNISHAECDVNKSGQVLATFRCGITDAGQLKQLIRALQAVTGVHCVKRVSTAAKPKPTAHKKDPQAPS
ncbi:MAG: bifunctional (p)ppGpp synthetase/guanosine-3',5'-bis(diphosphate) 3'-pyrophosphohydrolase [Myxococcota bacterium]